MKKNVLFVVDEKMMGGVSILLSDIVNLLNSKKYQIDILVLHNHGTCFNDLPSNVNIIYGTKFFNTVDYSIKEVLKSFNLRKIFSKIRLIYLMKRKKIEKYILRERRKILNKTYDVEVAFKDGFCALFTAYGDSKKKYHWLHMDYENYDCTAKYASLFREIYPKFDRIIGISKNILNHFIKKYPTDKVDIIYNIINPEKVRNKSLEEEISFNHDEINLVSIGRLHPVKGYDRLIEVFHQLDMENKLKNIKMRIIGPGSEYDNLKQQIDKYHLEDKIILLGKLDNPYPCVRESDMFIMCSRSEGYPLVLFESLILHVPILCLEIASIKEIMTDDYGIICENSEKGLYEGMLKIINNPDIINKYKDNLKNYDYDIKKILNQIEELLDE